MVKIYLAGLIVTFLSAACIIIPRQEDYDGWAGVALFWTAGLTMSSWTLFFTAYWLIKNKQSTTPSPLSPVVIVACVFAFCFLSLLALMTLSG